MSNDKNERASYIIISLLYFIIMKGLVIKLLYFSWVPFVASTGDFLLPRTIYWAHATQITSW